MRLSLFAILAFLSFSSAFAAPLVKLTADGVKNLEATKDGRLCVSVTVESVDYQNFQNGPRTVVTLSRHSFGRNPIAAFIFFSGNDAPLANSFTSLITTRIPTYVYVCRDKSFYFARQPNP